MQRERFHFDTFYVSLFLSIQLPPSSPVLLQQALVSHLREQPYVIEKAWALWGLLILVFVCRIG